MNMQNNLYTIQFFSAPNDRFTASPQAEIFHETPQKGHTHGKVQAPGQERIQTPGKPKSW